MSNIKPEQVLLFFIILSNIALVANWYFARPEKVASLIDDGVEIPVKQNAVKGHLGRLILKDDGQVEFHGWAFDVRNSRLVDAILLYYDGDTIYSGQSNANRPGIARQYGDKALTSGFRFVLSLDLFNDNEIDNTKVELFAVSNGVASELGYFRGFK